MTDHYAVLGVTRKATKAQIKDAYRRNARRLHPDVNPDPWAGERFKEMTHAYEVLRDDKSREEYDRLPPEEPQAQPASPDDSSFIFICKTVIEAIERERAVQMYAGNKVRSQVHGVAADILSKSLADYEAALRNPFSGGHRPVVLAVAEKFLQNATPTDAIAEQRSSGHLTNGVLGIVGLTRVAQIVGRDATPRAKESAARAVMFALGGALADAGLISLLPPAETTASLGRAYEYAKHANEAFAELESVAGDAVAS